MSGHPRQRPGPKSRHVRDDSSGVPRRGAREVPRKVRPRRARGHRAHAKPTPGERYLRLYLDTWLAPYELEPDLGQSTIPDYLLRTRQGGVLLEVSDLRPDRHDEELQKALALEKVRVGAVTGHTAVGAGPDYVTRVRDKLELELAQLKPFHEKYPCVVVFLNLRGLLVLDEHVLQPALTEVLQRGYRRVLGALAVLETVQPQAHHQQRHLRGLEKDGAIVKPTPPVRRGTGLLHPPHEHLVRALEALGALRREWGDAMDESYPRLVVYHNPYAAHRCPPTALPGRYDRHFRIVEDRNKGIVFQRMPVRGQSDH